MNQSELLQAAVAFLEAWERENDLCNRDEANSDAYFAACVKTAELALTFRLALPRGVSRPDGESFPPRATDGGAA